MSKVNVAIFGSGGREHALAWKIRQSSLLGDLVVAPGNPGVASVAELAEVEPTDIEAAVDLCRRRDIGLAVIGPEDPLALGLADALRGSGIDVFGPDAAAARLEADKGFAKSVMRQAAIPTGDARVFNDAWSAQEYVARREFPLVVKATGLAKGKGVTVCHRESDAMEAIDRAMTDRVFGEAGNSVMIEEFLQGVECSVLAFVDRRKIFLLPPCQDHKPVGEGNTGSMTGGMGAFSPTQTLDDRMLSEIEERIFVPTIDGLAREGVSFSGCLYAGLMLTPGGPKVLEFNVRFGDPETQPLMVRWQGDLLPVLQGVARGALEDVVDDVRWDPRTAVSVVLASRGYPGKSKTGEVITGVDEADAMQDVTVFHSGTALREGNLVNSGGRVLAVTALGEGIDDAREKAYAAVGKINFAGMHYRRDIGQMPGRMRQA